MPPCTAGKRSSIYRGVTRHRWTGRYEAHLGIQKDLESKPKYKGKQGTSRDANVSREDYLASLRRKSGGFSRGISKYRPLSSRMGSHRVVCLELITLTACTMVIMPQWTMSSTWFLHDRKIDLSSYIKWWAGNKARQTDSHLKMSEETKKLVPLTSLLSAPLLTNYNSIDPLTDPVLWTSLVPNFHTGSSRTAEVHKSEASSDYTLFQQED
ncbi:hypothetical protein HAX54_053465 [Datura stramonium]|uniref:Uncharacterized protein n=1 Tax=Datura stramonium TaxID=4076 RepID=A0ABS8WRX6_DATST|nr:hypothetical protein [Datura stramonium]